MQKHKDEKPRWELSTQCQYKFDLAAETDRGQLMKSLHSLFKRFVQPFAQIVVPKPVDTESLCGLSEE